MNTTTSPRQRLESLDALRGFDMIWIMGLGYVLRDFAKQHDSPFWNFITYFFFHSKWHGFVFWDLIFPLFIFLAGVSTPYSVGRKLENGTPKKVLLLKAFKRAAILFLLSLFVGNGGIQILPVDEIRIPGDLAKIGFAYFFGVVIYLYSNIRGRVIWTVAIMIAYWLLLKFTAAPGFAPGDLSPEGNFISYLERMYLPGKLDHGFYDQSGFYSNVSAIPNMIAGTLAGSLLKSEKISQIRKFNFIWIAGAICAFAGWLWHFDTPFNESLWTSSFTLASIGWSMILLAIFYFIIDIKKYKKWAFFLKVIGMNSILIYISPFFINWPYVTNAFFKWAIQLSGEYNDYVHGLAELGIKWVFLNFLYIKNIFLRV